MENTLKENEKVCIEQLKEATDFLKETNLVYETPLIPVDNKSLKISQNLNVFLKLENMQNNGSFKIRGVLNQFRNLNLKNDEKLVTFSAGNYGKTFAYVCNKNNLKAKIILPNSASEAKIKYIKSQGLETEKVEHTKLLETVEEHVNNGYKLVHPIDDKGLICCYSSITFEIIEQVPHPDIVLVCCGGGALLAGISTAFGLLNLKTIVYGVEPITANTMYQSFQKGYPIKLATSNSIANGLAPPITGRIAYYNCRDYVKDILLVTDDEIKETCKRLFEIGIKAELSGCAALAALIFNKIPNLEERKLNVVVIVSGGNVSAEEIVEINK